MFTCAYLGQGFSLPPAHERAPLGLEATALAFELQTAHKHVPGLEGVSADLSCAHYRTVTMHCATVLPPQAQPTQPAADRRPAGRGAGRQ